MSIWQWYVRRGRIDRRTWWLQYTVPLAALSALALLADVSLGNSDLAAILNGQQTFGPVFQLVTLLSVPASISASATRLHDRGMSAWWLPLAIVPVIGPLAFLVLNGFLRGDGGPNRYGPPPGWPPAPAAQPPAGEPLYPPPHWS